MEICSIGYDDFMNRKKQTIFKLFIAFFTIFIFVPVSSSTMILSYGLLGEVRSVLVYENEIQTEEQGNRVHKHNIESTKTGQIFNIWLLILAIILLIKYTLFALRLPIKETLVSRMVRMDN